MFVCCECCVLSGRGLCDGLITRPEESYRLWCVVVCDLENLKSDEAIARDWAVSAIKKKGDSITLFNFCALCCFLMVKYNYIYFLSSFFLHSAVIAIQNNGVLLLLCIVFLVLGSTHVSYGGTTTSPGATSDISNHYTN
jgi:hypothetical protein